MGKPLGATPEKKRFGLSRVEDGVQAGSPTSHLGCAIAHSRLNPRVVKFCSASPTEFDIVHFYGAL